MKKIFIITLLGAYFVSGNSQAQQAMITNEGGSFACRTEQAFDELTKAIVAKDMSWAKQIPGCGLLKKGSRATIDDYSMWGKSRILVHPPGGGRPISFWTNNENFKLLK